MQVVRVAAESRLAAAGEHVEHLVGVRIAARRRAAGAEMEDPLRERLAPAIGVEQGAHGDAVVVGRRRLAVVGVQGPIHGGDCRGTVYPVAVAAVDLVRRSYDAFERGDMDAVMADMHPEIEWHQAQGLPHGGLYRGLAEVRRNIFDPLDEQWWDEFTADPEEFLDAGADGGRRGPLSRDRQGDGQTTGRALRPYLDGAGQQGDSVPPVPRYGRLGERARDLIIDIFPDRGDTRCLLLPFPRRRTRPKSRRRTYI